MNPYLEQEDVWHDFHERFLPAAAAFLTPQVRPKYIVRLDEHAYIHELPANERHLAGRPDIGVAARPGAKAGIVSSQAAAAPAYVGLPVATDVERQAFIEIRDRANRELVSVIELLSPSNKRVGGDRDQYLGKRQEFIQSPAHFVELDLLRGGPRMPLDGLPSCDYYALVSRAGDRPQSGIWTIHLRDVLPAIPIPLRTGDPDASLDLQQVLHRVYDAAGYEDYIYAGSPQPPLSHEDALWAREFVPGSTQV
jgi:hypothetical protein